MRQRTAPFFGVAFLVLVIDQLTKYAVENHVQPFEIIRVLPFLNIVYVENVGSAFGLFKTLGNVFFITVAAVAIVIVGIMIVKDKDNRLSFSLILGGAAGNLADRIARGYVVDFIDLYVGRHHWPSFNVADSALTLGIVFLAAGSILGQKKPAKDG